jgi:hypothetical protein
LQLPAERTMMPAERMMTLNFLYAAHTYIDDWVAYDRKAHEVLGIDSGALPEAAQAYEQLLRVAKGYAVMRNFNMEDGGIARLAPVRTALQEIATPVSDEDAKACVADFVTALQRTYHRDLWSAASKFLWMRFRQPIIIYDSLAWKWMCDDGRCPANGGYGGFHDAWRSSFEEHRQKVHAACEDLLSARVRRFLCPSDVTELEYEASVSSRWFAERVFDHALLNAVSGVE